LGAWWWLAESGKVALGTSGGRFTQEIGDSLLPVGVEIHDIPIGCDSPDALFAALAMERNQFHRKP
jgi:hypothetical protein